MKFRRSKSEEAGNQADVDTEQVSSEDEQGEQDGPVTGAAAPTVTGPRHQGPWDSAEVQVDDEDPTNVDLGGLIVTGRPGLELRLQVDEASQQVAAVLLVGKEGAVELRPFAAPRNTDIWDDIRRQIAAETTRRGGTATEAEGVYGKELKVMMPVTTPDGKNATQPSRVLGISGPRWLLRATLLGRPAVEAQEDGDVEAALRDVVVVRGNAPMAPGDPLPLNMPANAQPMRQPEG